MEMKNVVLNESGLFFVFYFYSCKVNFNVFFFPPFTKLMKIHFYLHFIISWVDLDLNLSHCFPHTENSL